MRDALQGTGNATESGNSVRGCREPGQRQTRSRVVLLLLALFASFRLVPAADHHPDSVGRGFSYQRDEVREKPWSIHIVRVDRSQHDLGLHTTLGGGDRIGLSTLSAQIRTLPPELGRPVAAINGDYYYRSYPYAGDPKGLQILRGQLVSGPSDWTCFWIEPSGALHMTSVVSHFEVTWPNGETMPIGLNEERASDAAVLYTAAVGASTHTSGGRELVLEQHGTNTWLPLQAGCTYLARVRAVRDTGDSPLSRDCMVLSLGREASTRVPKVAPGAVLRISTATYPDLKGVTTAIGGGPPLVREARAISRHEVRFRHPRTAIGWNERYLFLVEVDGRQRNLSVGMTYAELANYMVKLGCDEAMSLDGGGSSTMWFFGQVMNNPSEGRERPMANALVLVHEQNK